jgi:anti-sigma factor RsiW
MKCIDCIDRFDDFLDGQLDKAEGEALRRHLETCADCADELAGIREIRQQAAALPRAIDPPGDLWPGIAEAIESSKVVRGRFLRHALLAAAAAVLVVTSVVTAYFVGRSQAVVIAVATPVAESGASAVLLASFEGLGVENYETRRGELLAALDARSHELSPATMNVVMDNLMLIDHAMDRIAEALGEDPENERLMKQLAGAYRRQIDLLQRAVGLPAEV